MRDLICILVGLDNNNPAAYVRAEAGDISLGSYVQASVRDLQSALTAFITAAGPPWVAIGDVSEPVWTNGSHGTIAVNLDQAGFGFSDAGTGIKFSNAQFPTLGYAPWDNYADAAAAINALVRNVTWSPAS